MKDMSERLSHIYEEEKEINNALALTKAHRTERFMALFKSVSEEIDSLYRTLTVQEVYMPSYIISPHNSAEVLYFTSRIGKNPSTVASFTPQLLQIRNMFSTSVNNYRAERRQWLRLPSNLQSIAPSVPLSSFWTKSMPILIPITLEGCRTIQQYDRLRTVM